MFAWFERLVDPYPDAPPAVPPKRLGAFLWACSAGTRKYIALMTLLTAGIGAFEALLFAMMGRIVDWLSTIPPAELWAREGGTLALLAVVLARQHRPGRAAERFSSSRRWRATSRCGCAGTSTGCCSGRAWASTRTSSPAASRPR